ncbi:MAG: TolC family protein [Gemmatimonadota bacterium]|nr:MAG: TolC family protein [Gemmatimonadota bacterium]
MWKADPRMSRAGSIRPLQGERHSSRIWGSKRRVQAWVCVVATLLAVAEVRAQQIDTVLSLSEARTLLRQGSPEYRAARASADAAGEGVWSAWGSWIPSATLSMNLSRNEFTTRTFLDPTGVAQELPDPITDVAKSSSQALIFNWSLFAGGTRFFDVGASRARARAADLAAEATLVRLESQAEVQYWEALRQQEQARLAKDLLAARRRDVEIAEARFRIAAVAQTDVLQAEVQVGQNEVAVLQAEQQAEAARRELSATLGMEESVDYQLSDSATVFDPSGLTISELVVMARGSNPALARFDAEIEAADKSLWSARGTWLPRIDLSYSLSRSEQLPGDQSLFEFAPRNTGNNFGIRLSWPLLNGFEKKWRTGEASARLQEARHNKVNQLLQNEKDVRNQYDALVSAYQAYQIRSRLIELARESVRLATERYRIGATSYLELQRATDQLTDAERGLIDARYNFMQALARLEGAIGRRLARTP